MIFDTEIDFESQNFAIFMARFLIGRWSVKDHLQWESAIHSSFSVPFPAQPPVVEALAAFLPKISTKYNSLVAFKIDSNLSYGQFKDV